MRLVGMTAAHRPGKPSATAECKAAIFREPVASSARQDLNNVNGVIVKGINMKKQIITAMLALFALPVFAQQHFSTPEKAATALEAAISSHNEQALTEVLGDNWRRYLPPEGADPEAVARFLRDWKDGHQIVTQGDKAHLNVGLENWQLPIPMIKTGSGWHFDMAEAADEIQVREVGRNELAAIQAMHGYVDAQEEYYQRFQNYAGKLISSEGKKTVFTGPYSPAKILARWGLRTALPNPAWAITATASVSFRIKTSRASL